MKKQLLTAVAILTVATSFAARDAVEYPTVNGIECTNIWVNCRAIGYDTFVQYPFIAQNQYGKVRTATLLIDADNPENNKILVGWSKTDADNNDNATLGVINFGTGEWEKEVALTYNGTPIQGLLCANQIGTDDFGNVWFAGLCSNASANPVKLYKIDNIESGECSLAGELALPADEASAAGRIDYYDVLGDITGVEWSCYVMCAARASNCAVYRWKLEQGGTIEDWRGDFGDYVCWNGSNLETYPADQTAWGGAMTMTIITNEEMDGSQFYVDDFNTAPVIYNTSTAVVDGFMYAPSELVPATGTNGVGEFILGDKNFVAYSVAQYNANPGCQVRVAEIPELSFENMESYWMLPEAGLGTQSDGGTRIHNVSTFIHTDANGKQGCYLLTYKCNNGLGVYQIAEEGFIPVYEKSGVEGINVDEADAPAEYYNLQGVKVANPENGLYIVKRGNNATKEVIKN